MTYVADISTILESRGKSHNNLVIKLPKGCRN